MTKEEYDMAIDAIKDAIENRRQGDFTRDKGLDIALEVLKQRSNP